MKIALLILTLGVSMILIGLVHPSLDLDATTMIAGSQNHPNEVENPSSTSKESARNTPTYIDAYLNILERSDQIVDEQPEKASCSDAVDSNESHGQVSNVPTGESVPIPAPLPDGRIFPRGEPPYGYLPTCSPKDKDLPFVPVEPD